MTKTLISEDVEILNRSVTLEEVGKIVKQQKPEGYFNLGAFLSRVVKSLQVKCLDYLLTFSCVEMKETLMKKPFYFFLTSDSGPSKSCIQSLIKSTN